MSTLLILNDPPYGTERSCNGLRLAKALSGKGAKVSVFLMADAVAGTKAGQKLPQGYYNLELMVKAVTRQGRGGAFKQETTPDALPAAYAGWR